MLQHNVLALLQTPQFGAEAWDMAKSVMITLSTLGVGYLVKTVRAMEFSVRSLQTTVTGEDGRNGLRGDTKLHNSRLAKLEEWRTKLDTAAAVERELYEGEERRQTSRRVRDKLLNNELMAGDL